MSDTRTNTPPGEFDTSGATDSALTLEEANEKGYYGYTFDDGDYTVAGVTGTAQVGRVTVEAARAGALTAQGRAARDR